MQVWSRQRNACARVNTMCCQTASENCWFTSSPLLLAYCFRVILPHRTPMRQHGRSGIDVCTDVVCGVSPFWLLCRRNTEMFPNTHTNINVPEFIKRTCKTNRGKKKGRMQFLVVLGTKSLLLPNHKIVFTTPHSEALRYHSKIKAEFSEGKKEVCRLCQDGARADSLKAPCQILFT